MDLIIFALGLLGVGIVLGWLAATHIHSVANAATRATTIPAGDVAAMNARLDGFGTKLQAIADSVTKPAIAAAVTDATKTQ